MHAYVQHKADQTGKTGQEAVQRGRSVVDARNGQRISMNRSRKREGAHMHISTACGMGEWGCWVHDVVRYRGIIKRWGV